jgi:hypothetical protein
MAGRFLLSSVLGALALFMAGAISWMALPFRAANLGQFQDEDKVAAVLAENTNGHGLYVFPRGTESLELNEFGL